MKTNKKPLHALLVVALASSPVMAEESQAPTPGAQLLEGDIRLACEATLCLSNKKGLDAKECVPSLKRYFKIKFKRRPGKTLRARKDFLKLCPLSESESKDGKTNDELIEEIMANADDMERAENFTELMQQAEAITTDDIEGSPLTTAAQAPDQEAIASAQAAMESMRSESQAAASRPVEAQDETAKSRTPSQGARQTSRSAQQDMPVLTPEENIKPTPDAMPPTTPTRTGESLCLSAEQLIGYQGTGDGYMTGVNPSWTWSHSSWAGSAKPGYDYQPDWVRSQFPWMRDVPQDKWTLMMPWYVASTVSGDNSAAQVEIGDMSVQYYSASQKRWISLGANMAASGGTFKSGASGSGKPDTETGSVVDIPSGQFAHGWFNFVNVPPVDDIQAVSVAVQARSKTDTPVLVEAGADYYPNDWQQRLGNGPLMPGLGTSAPSLVGRDWKTVAFTTMSNQTADGSGISPEELAKSQPHCK